MLPTDVTDTAKRESMLPTVIVDPNGQRHYEVTAADVASIEPASPETIAETLFPDMGTTKKGRYLALRACGFKIREACRLTPITQQSVNDWRTDQTFRELEKRAVGELRDKLIKEHLTIEFTRNYALILIKDHMVLKKAVDGSELSEQEQKYLLKARPHYTPQQLQILRELSMLGDKTKEGNWTDFVLRVSRTTEVVEVMEK